MISTKYVRDNIALIKESLAKRRSDYPIDELLELDAKWRAGKTSLQELQAKRNKDSIAVSEAKKKGSDTKALLASLAKLKTDIPKLEAEAAANENRIEQLLWNMPNVLDKTVPYGESEEQNVQTRTWGTIEKNKKSANHQETLEKLGLIDIKQASIVSGARFYYLKGDLALLEQALIRFGIDELIKKGYTLVAPPLMLKKEFYRGATALGDFEELLYKVADPNEADPRKIMKRPRMNCS